MHLLKIFDDKDGNGGGQKKSDDLRTMTTIGQHYFICRSAKGFIVYASARFETDLHT